MKNRIWLEWLIPSIRLALFVMLYDIVVTMFFGKHISYEDIEIHKSPNRYLYNRERRPGDYRRLYRNDF
jgi:hypothetical protein